MVKRRDDVGEAVQIFLRGFSVGKSLTHPYLCEPIDQLWALRDAPRRNPRNYRKEEWVAYGVEPRKVDAVARRHTRGRFFVSAIENGDQPSETLKSAYKELGYRLIGTEPLFVHRLKRIPRPPAPVEIIRLNSKSSPALVTEFAKVTRSKPLSPEYLSADAPFRQYVAIDGKQVIGWVRSVKALDSTWCSHMEVVARHRRRGIGTTLLAKMLRDDRTYKSRRSVLLASRLGALIYPRVGYEQIGVLRIYAAGKR